MTEQHYTIKQVAERTGLSAYTLRYYEQLGLIDEVNRAANGHRRYTDDDLLRIKFIFRLRETGMTLEDMLRFIDLYRQEDDGAVYERHAMLTAHRATVQMQIDALCETLAYIDNKLSLYETEMAHDPEQTATHADSRGC